MACLGSVLYDPTTLATASTTSLSAMTAMDTTNARITFTAPANGIVLVRIRVPEKSSAGHPDLLLGVLDGATVRGRQLAACVPTGLGSTSSLIQREAVFIVTGLTPSNSYTWDAAYAVQVVGATAQIGWGGPNNTTANDAYGALSFEIWDTSNLLAGVMYDPAVAVTKSTASALAMTAFDTTNLRLSFTAPASGKVLVRLRCTNVGSASIPAVMLGALDGATVRGRQTPFAYLYTASAGQQIELQSEFVVSGLSGAYTWDAAYGVELVQASSNIVYGGPNDASGSDAYGGFAFEVWKA